VPPPSPDRAAVVAFPGYVVVAAAVDRAWFAANTKDGDFGTPMSPAFLTALEQRLAVSAGNLDAMLMGSPLPGPPALDLHPLDLSEVPGPPPAALDPRRHMASGATHVLDQDHSSPPDRSVPRSAESTCGHPADGSVRPEPGPAESAPGHPAGGSVSTVSESAGSAFLYSPRSAGSGRSASPRPARGPLPVAGQRWSGGFGRGGDLPVVGRGSLGGSGGGGALPVVGQGLVGESGGGVDLPVVGQGSSDGSAWDGDLPVVGEGSLDGSVGDGDLPLVGHPEHSWRPAMCRSAPRSS
jgi:hypothetical protein